MSLTPTEDRMMKILYDGLSHRREELHLCVNDELTPLSNVTAHIHNLRRKIKRHGQDILCIRDYTGVSYRLVRLLASPYDGKR